MKVYIPFLGLGDVLGALPNFCTRLANAMQTIPGVRLVDIPSEADVRIHCVSAEKIYKTGIDVLRLDGLNFNIHENMKMKNRKTVQSFGLVDGIVYQTSWVKRQCDRYLGESKVPWKVIFNGANTEAYRQHFSQSSIDCPYFLTIAKWKPLKRLKETIGAFLLADMKDTKLVVVGEFTEKGTNGKTPEDVREDYIKQRGEFISHPNIVYLGELCPSEIFPYQVHALGNIHLAWNDACPNVVVEAICAKKPVICGNSGGTPELVGPSGGQVLKIDNPMDDLSPRNILHPPCVDLKYIAQAMRNCRENYQDINIYTNHVDIRTTAWEYYSFFRELLEKQA